MGPDRIVELLTKAIDAWTKGDLRRRAKVLPARDPFDVLEMLLVSPEKALITVLWNGDQPEEIGQDADTGDVGPARNAIEVTVGCGLGLDAAKDWRLVLGKGGRESVIGRVADVRALVLALHFPADDETTLQRFSYRGCEPVVTPDGVPLAAYKLRFEIVATVDVSDDVEVTVEE
jgi:hypothetical protein